MFRVADDDGEVTTMHDPYAFDSLLTDFDFYLFGQGRHERIYEKLGAHVRTVDGVTGTNFAVWAPNATSVSVVGDFNKWDARRHPMRKHIPSGIWELFVPDVGRGRAVQIPRPQLGRPDRLTRPIRTDSPPNCLRARRRSSPICTVTTGTTRTGWTSVAVDDPLNQPISIYEVHLGSWRRSEDHHHGWLNYRELARATGRLLPPDGLHAPGIVAGQRAPLHGQLGIPDGGLFRGHQPLWHAGRLHVFRRLLSSQRDRRDSGLGPGSLPEGRAWPAAIRRHGTL